jgi:hypothetical protein
MTGTIKQIKAFGSAFLGSGFTAARAKGNEVGCDACEKEETSLTAEPAMGQGVISPSL